MDKEQIARLKELAEKATPGPWEAVEDGYKVNIAYEPVLNDKEIPGVDRTGRTFGCGCGDRFICDLNDWEYHEYRDLKEQKANAAFIAAANPQAVLALIAEIERLEKEADWLAQKWVDNDCPDELPCPNETGIFSGTCVCCWREAARKAVEENNAKSQN